MRWPWQRKVEPTPIEAKIEEQTAKHMKVLQRARRVLSGATDDIERAERMIEDYERADQERRR